MPKYNVTAHHPVSGAERTFPVDAESAEQATWRGRDGGWIVDDVEEIEDSEDSAQQEGESGEESQGFFQPANEQVDAAVEGEQEGESSANPG